MGRFLLVLLIERNNLPWRNARESNEIRLNVDMREASKAIPRTHTVTPTLDDIINELKRATVFSHLNMNHGYRQLELKENSRDITTFATFYHFWYEIFQETVSKEITRDIVGCINISDDILLFGRNQKEHDQNLERSCLRELERKKSPSTKINANSIRISACIMEWCS